MISIVVPIYNAEKYLESCLNSIQNQTYKNFECLLIDDGSVDKSAEICNRWVLIDSRFIYIKQSNSGVSKARNVGVNMSKGDWITFVDADDIVSPLFLEKAMKYVDRHVDLVIGGLMSGSEEEYLNLTNDNYGVLCFEDNSIDELKPHLMTNIIHFGKGGVISRGPICRLVKAKICRNVPFNEKLKLSEDILWNFELIDKCKKIYIVKQIWYLYRQNIDSKVHRYNSNVINEFEDALNQIFKCINSENEKELFAYCDMLVMDIKIIAKSFLCNKEFDLSKEEKSKIVNKLYTSMPWNYINKKEYFKYANIKRKIVSILFRHRLLFCVLKFFC